MAGQAGNGPCSRRALPPQTQGKIERWHQTLKNRILLENYYLPGDRKAQIEAFIDHYNRRRIPEPLQQPAQPLPGQCQTQEAQPWFLRRCRL